MKGSAAELELVTKNAKVLSCDWAVIFYSNTTEARQFQPKICNSLHDIQCHIRHCQGTIFNATQYRHLVDEYVSQSTKKLVNMTGESFFLEFIASRTADEHMFIPKQVMYFELLPYLKEYENVIVMDSDMLFTHKVFNFTEVKTILQRGYKYPIKVAQPCIIGPVEFPTFHQDRWINQDHVAIGIDFVEQQSFFVDSLVFEWSIRAILSKIVDYHIVYLSDWGYDSVLCLAAKAFTELVLGEPVDIRKDNPVSVILTRHCVGHENTKTIKKTVLFNKSGYKMLQYYHRFFPHWFYDITSTVSGLKPESQYTVHWDVAIPAPQY